MVGRICKLRTQSFQFFLHRILPTVPYLPTNYIRCTVITHCVRLFDKHSRVRSIRIPNTCVKDTYVYTVHTRVTFQLCDRYISMLHYARKRRATFIYNSIETSCSVLYAFVYSVSVRSNVLFTFSKHCPFSFNCSLFAN